MNHQRQELRQELQDSVVSVSGTSIANRVAHSISKVKQGTNSKILRARRSRHLLLNSALKTEQKNCTHEISTMCLPKQD